MTNHYIEVLGAKYRIVEDSNLENEYGSCSYYDKKIKINTKEIENECGSKEEYHLLLDEILRHEIIHAYFYECGLSEYSHDETLVDNLAINFNKLTGIINYEMEQKSKHF